MMATGVDQTTDRNGQDLYRLTKLCPPPAFVKEASVLGVCGPEGLPTNAYADPVTRQFPCHTPAATWVSTLFFLDKRAQLPVKRAAVIDDRLAEFARFHRIHHTVQDLRDKFATNRQSGDAVLADEDFALIVTGPNGQRERHFPVPNAKAVKTAAAYLLEHRDQFTWAERHTIAGKLLEKAAATGAAIREYIEELEKMAGHGGGSAAEAAELLWNRARSLGDLRHPSQVQVELAKLAATCLTRPQRIHEPAVRYKLAEIVDRFDRAHGLKGRYSELLPRPEDVLFKVTHKMATDLATELCPTTSGSVYHIADFEQLPLSEIRAHMGSEFADAVSRDGLAVDPEKLAEVASTLPRNDAELFERLLAVHNIQPQIKRAAQEPLGLRESDLNELAARHTA